MNALTELTLRIHVEGSPEKIVAVSQNEYSIGRLPECDLPLPYSEVSRYHCRLARVGCDRWLLEDTGSTNGTLLNQHRLSAAREIHHGDVVQVGNVFLFVELSTVSSEESPPPASTSQDVKTILRSAEALRQQWLSGDEAKDPFSTEHITSARLKYIVEIAKGLNSAESIDAIFMRVQEVVFREFKSVERIALLIDLKGTGRLELYRAAARNFPPTSISGVREQPPPSPPQLSLQELYDGNWISRSICQKVFTEKVAIKTLDAQRDERFVGSKSIAAKGIGGALAVPLWDEKQAFGVLYADARLGLSRLDPSEDQDLSFFSTIANLVAASVQRWLLTRRLQQEERIRQRLERYHSPAVVQQLIRYGAASSGNFTPVEADVSVLFADLVGFTALSERFVKQPEEVAKLLNRFFEEMLDPLFDEGGTLDKFIGDCIMAFFGAPEPQKDHADRAVRVARGMLLRLEELNARQVWPEPLQLRIAINSGKAVVGDVGSSQRVDYTVLGATVNLASRLEAICLPGECVIGEASYDKLGTQLKGDFSRLREFTFKGIDRPVRVYRGRWQHEPYQLMELVKGKVKSSS